jgi:Icc protein
VVQLRLSFHTADSTAYPQPAPGTGPGPKKDVPAGELRKYLGVRTVDFIRGRAGFPALTDSPLAA